MLIIGKFFKFIWGLLFYAIMAGMAVGGIGVAGYLMMLAYSQGKETTFYGCFIALIVIAFWAIVFQCLRAWFPKDVKQKKRKQSRNQPPRRPQTTSQQQPRVYLEPNTYQPRPQRPQRPSRDYRRY